MRAEVLKDQSPEYRGTVSGGDINIMDAVDVELRQTYIVLSSFEPLDDREECYRPEQYK